jgi:two-component system, cell cycle sensor histidine kinase and response regulator CckA
MTEQQENSQQFAQANPSLKIIMDASPMGIVVFDSHIRVIYVNPLAAHLFDKSTNVASGLKCGDFINCAKRHENSQECGRTKSCSNCLFVCAICVVLSDESNETFQQGETLLERASGQPNIWVKYKVSSIMVEGSKVAIMTIDDITDYKQNEEKLRNALAELSVIHEHAPIAMMLVDKNRRICKINGFAAKFIGRPESEMIGLRGGEALRCLHHLADPQGCGFGPACEDCRVRNAVLDTFDSKTSRQNIESWMPLIKGNSIMERYLLISTAFLKIDKTENVLLCIQDITDRKQAEEALRKSEAKYRALIENTHDIIYSLNRSGEFSFVSQGWTRLLGHDVSEVEGKDFRVFVHPDDIEICEEFLQKVIENQEPQSDIEYRVIHVDGSYRWHTSNGYPLLDNQQKFISFIGVAHDITGQKYAEVAIKDAHQRLLTVLDNINAIVYVIDMESYEILFVNQYVRNMFGKAEDKKCWSVIHPDQTGPCDFCTNHELVDPEGNPTGIYRWELNNKKTKRWYDCHDSAIKWIDNRIVKLQVAIDITDRKLAEEALRESEEKYRRITENISDVVWITDLNLKNIYVSPSIKRLIGEPVAVNINRTMEQRFPPESLENIYSIIGEELEKENDPGIDENRTRVIEAECYRTDGSTIWVSMNISFIRDENGKPIGFQGVTRDINDRKKAEEALLASEQRYREIFNATSEAIFIDDAHTGKVLDVNEPMLRMYGYNSKEEVFAGNIGDFRANQAPYTEEEAKKITRAAVDGKKQQFEWLAKKKNGELFPVEITLTRSLIGGHERVLAVVRDITCRKQEEQEREKLQLQFVQSQKLESIGRLAGGVAHDYNNTLMVIMGYTELAMEKISPNNPLYTYFEEILIAAQRSTEITRQLLAFARKQTINPSMLDLNRTIESMLKMLRRLIDEDINLVWVPKPQIWPVKMDTTQLDQVILNLCLNARDAIAGVGKIIIETKNITLDENYCSHHPGFFPGDFVLLAISDDGCGMDKGTLNNIFEPFFTTKDVGQGTGLGLSTVYGIIRQNKGFINVYSEPDKGTTFNIYLPRHAMETSEIKIEKDEKDEKITSYSFETVMVVEDEPAIMKISKMMLQMLGYQVLTASTPTEAIRSAQEYPGPIHLLITDVVMPEMNGCDLANQLQSFNPGIKVLFMSGYTANVIAHHGLLDKSVHFIQKPFSKNEIAAKIRQILEES